MDPENDKIRAIEEKIEAYDKQFHWAKVRSYVLGVAWAILAVIGWNTISNIEEKAAQMILERTEDDKLAIILADEMERRRESDSAHEPIGTYRDTSFRSIDQMQAFYAQLVPPTYGSELDIEWCVFDSVDDWNLRIMNLYSLRDTVVAPGDTIDVLVKMTGNCYAKYQPVVLDFSESLVSTPPPGQLFRPVWRQEFPFAKLRLPIPNRHGPHVIRCYALVHFNYGDACLRTPPVSLPIEIR